MQLGEVVTRRTFPVRIGAIQPTGISGRVVDLVIRRPASGRNRMCWAMLVVLIICTPVGAQTPDEHQQHHPAAPSAPPPAPIQPAVPGSPSGPSRQGGEMGGMMEGGMGGMMGVPPPKALYPSLMDLPALTPERRQEFERLAGERMMAGSALMAAAFERLTAATRSGDAAGMQEANAQIREGLAQFESGLAVRRAITEGRAPRDMALDWFRREMNLVPLTNSPPAHGLFGLSWFHYITILILAAFAVTMVVMYFHKMRRAEALVTRLAGGTGGAGAAIEGPSTSESPAGPAPSPATAAAAATTEGMPAVSPAVAPSKSNSWTGLLRVARIFQETSNVKTVRLIDPWFGKLPFAYLPGQFLTVTVAPDDGPIKRSYTISSSPTERDYCEITVKREGQGAVSRFLHDRVHEDDTLQVTAPSGRFTFTGEESTSVVLISGGVGVTPMMSAARYLTKRSWRHDIYFVYSVREEADIIFREELEYLQRRYPNLHVIIAVGQNASDERYVKGRITREVLAARIPELPTRRVHICGPPPMMDAVKEMLIGLGVPTDQIRTEVFIGKETAAQPLATVPAAEAKVAVVTFARSRRTTMMPPTKTVLEASEDVGVSIEYSCRVGICGVCRVKLLSGAVTMEVEDGLEPGDKSKHIILACQAKSTADLSVDA